MSVGISGVVSPYPTIFAVDCFHRILYLAMKAKRSLLYRTWNRKAPILTAEIEIEFITAHALESCHMVPAKIPLLLWGTSRRASTFWTVRDHNHKPLPESASRKRESIRDLLGYLQ